ncbi:MULTISPECIES: hypothetical protein [unclassified Bradyrhizobium]|uniref:hypothetical protein n=1 Tax=unclassified Bradyrhizobium TaxID=2631580 RepID=UPI0028EE7D0B|nr:MULTISPECIES: hypothetical protein [unclassified Bradyrhizobium]
MTKAIGMTFVEGILIYYAVVNGRSFPGHAGPDAFKSALADAGAIENAEILKDLLYQEFLENIENLIKDGSSVVISTKAKVKKRYLYFDKHGVQKGQPFASIDELVEECTPSDTPPLKR